MIFTGERRQRNEAVSSQTNSEISNNFILYVNKLIKM